MINDAQILPLLLEAGPNGLTADKMARHIFNATNSFFEPVEFADVKRQVESFVRRNSRHSYSLLERTATRPARYRVNPVSPQLAQLSFNFDQDDTPAPPSTEEELELPLFLELD